MRENARGWRFRCQLRERDIQAAGRGEPLSFICLLLGSSRCRLSLHATLTARGPQVTRRGLPSADVRCTSLRFAVHGTHDSERARQAEELQGFLIFWVFLWLSLLLLLLFPFIPHRVKCRLRCANDDHMTTTVHNVRRLLPSFFPSLLPYRHPFPPLLHLRAPMVTHAATGADPTWHCERRMVASLTVVTPFASHHNASCPRLHIFLGRIQS